MLLSWRDELRVALTPTRVAAVRVSRRSRARLVAEHAVDVEPGSTRACLDALASIVAEPLSKDTDATVVLSNHFVRYAIVPWSEHLVADEEKRAWIAHHFAQLFGEPVVGAEYRWSEAGVSAPCVASAMPAELVSGIRGAFEHAPARLRSIQPYLMAAFNRCKAHVKSVSVWLVLPERGRVCVASIVNGAWRTISSRNLSSDWQSEVALLLDRQRVLAGEDAPAVVLAYGVDAVDVAHVDYGDAQVKLVAPKPLAGYAPQPDAFAIALTGVV